MPRARTGPTPAPTPDVGRVRTGGGEDPLAIDRVQALGRTLRVLDPPEPVLRRIDALDARQADALGAAHATVRDLRVGVVGGGGLGSPAAEALARIRAPVHAVALGERPDRRSLVLVVASDLLEQLHLRSHPFCDLRLGLSWSRDGRAAVGLGGASSSGHGGAK